MSRDTQEPPEENSAQPTSSGEISHLIIGRILSPRGVKGELKVQVLTDFPERFTKLKKAFVGDQLALYEVEAVRFHKNTVLMKLRGVNNADEAERLRGSLIRVPVAEAVPLEEDQYYWHQVIGLEVWTTSGELVGKVMDILETGANDVYVVRSDSREVLIPAIADVVKEIAPDKGKMIIEPMPGLLD